MILKDWLKELSYTLISGSLEQEVNEVIYDSRKASAGSVFVCMKGTKTDSHDFIGSVIEKGVKVIVAERPVKVPEGVTLLQVENGRNALALMSAARFGEPAKKLITIGITGTKGKTTTTHMIKQVLETAGIKTGMIGTTGVVIGERTYPTVNTTPESYDIHRYFAQMADEGCRCAVMEVSSQAFKMHRVDGIVFDYGMFTNISPDHIGPDEHESFEEYLDFKAMLLSACRTGLVNRDDSHFEEIVKNASCRLFTYGLEQKADFMAENIRYISEHDFVGLEFQVSGNYELDLKVNIAGRFNVYNALAAVSLCSFLNLEKDRVAHALEHLQVNGRMEIVYTSKKCTVLVDYAHNAVSMESLLSTLRHYQPKRLVVVFGCGGNRSRDRRYSMGEIGGKMADLCILTADNSRFEKPEDIIADIRGSVEKTGGAFIEIPDRREAIFYAVSHAEEGDMIAVIGKGHEDYQEINGVRYPFLDKAVILEAIEELKKEGKEV